MPVSVKGIDHFVIRAADLDAAEACYRRLGFVLTPRGFHAGRGSSNHTAPLSSGNYFELIHLSKDSDNARFASRAEGPVALALQPSDSLAVHAELTALGYDVPPPRDLSRAVHLPGGIREARFLNASFPEIAPEAVALFTCQHLTRDLVWRPEWEGHANGVDRVTGIIVVHPSPADLAATQAKLFGAAAVQREADELAVKIGPDTMTILMPSAFAVRYPGVSIPTDLARGWFAGATFRTRSVAAVAALLARENIPASRSVSGGVVVGPNHAVGTLLEFQAG